MAIPPRRWVGYALLVVGLSLLFDTYTFLRTNWSPLHVPMSVPDELVLGYSLAAGGMVVLLAPALVRLLDSFAPDRSMKMGQGLAHESVEFRRKLRLPLLKRMSVLPNRGLVGGFIVLLLLPMFVMFGPLPYKGIYVRLTPARGTPLDQDCLVGPIVVTVKGTYKSSELLLDGTVVRQEELGQRLKAKLATRAHWDVYVEGDDSISFADPMNVIDAINTLHAKAVILTPRLKEQMAKACSSR